MHRGAEVTFNELERRHGVVLRLDHMVAQKTVVVRLNFLDRIVLDLDDVFEADEDLQRWMKLFVVTISTKINSTSLSLKLPEMKEKLANKAFYKADNCTFYWSSTGNHLLALASTDTSQDSYYGENTLYLLNARNGERLGNF